MTRGMNWVLWGSIVAVGLAQAAPASACMFGRRRSVQTTANYQPAACSACGVAPAVAVAPVAVAPAVAVAPVAAPVVAMAAPVAAPVVAMAAPAPIAVQETRMVQRCYLAPVTTMQTQTQLENVTTLRTEFFDEAVTTMQTSAYFDPCGCGYRAVTTPVTTTVRRSRVVPVTQTVARSVAVPVTRMEQRFYMEPVVETRMYMPATPAVAVATPAVAVATPAVAATPVVAQTISPTPVVAQAVPAVAPTAVAAQAVPAQAMQAAPVTAQYTAPGMQAVPATPGMQAVPGQQPQGGAAPQFYQNPNAPTGDNRTLIIERVIQNGQVTQENKRYLNPGEAVPAPQSPAAPSGEVRPVPADDPVVPAAPPATTTPSGSTWLPAPAQAMPVGQQTSITNHRSAKMIPVSMGSPFYH